MLTALLFAVLAIGTLIVILLVIVVAGIRREPPAIELSRRAPGLVSAMTRRLLGVYVRRPDPDQADRRDTCLAGQAPGQGADGEAR